MGWHKHIGVDTDLLKKVDPKHSERQTFILSNLTLMLFVITGICFISSVVFSLIIFHNWLIAIATGVFLAFVVFNLYRLFVMTALDVSGSSLEPYFLEHEKHYSEYIKLDQDFTEYPDEQIIGIVNVAKNSLREKTSMDFQTTSTKLHPLTMTLRVAIICIIALVFCNGMELLLFKNQINEVLSDLISLYESKNEVWIVENILKPQSGQEFYILNTNSLLLSLDILNQGLGYWKVVIDLLFMTIFLLPLIIVFKSKEIKQSEYVRELALSELTITFYHYIHTQKLSKTILNKINATPIALNDNLNKI
jgi:hypothetical protein